MRAFVAASVVVMICVAATACAPATEVPATKPVPVESPERLDLIVSIAGEYLQSLSAHDSFGAAFRSGRQTVDVDVLAGRAFGTTKQADVRVLDGGSARITSPPVGIVPSSTAEPGASAAFWRARIPVSTVGSTASFDVEVTGQIDSVDNVVVFEAVPTK